MVTGLTQKAAINKQVGQYVVKATPQPFWEAGINYRSKLNKTLFLLTGLKGTASGRNVVLKVPVEEINPIYTESHSLVKLSEFDFVISVPLLLEKEWQIKQYKIAYVQAGLNLRYALGYDMDGYGYSLMDTTRQWIHVFDVKLN